MSQTPQVYLDHQVYQRGGHLYLSWDAVEELFPPGLLDDMFGAYCAFLQRLALDEAAWRETKADLLPSAQVAQRAVRERHRRVRFRKVCCTSRFSNRYASAPTTPP